MNYRPVFVLAILSLLATPGMAQDALPDAARTPGALNPVVTQQTIHRTICVPGWTKTVRPPSGYTNALKRRQIKEFGYSDPRLGEYEEDHLVPLGLGGAPYAPANLWPQPRLRSDNWTAEVKDLLEVALARLVCARRVPLAEAQAAIAQNWIAAYNHYVAGEP